MKCYKNYDLTQKYLTKVTYTEQNFRGIFNIQMYAFLVFGNFLSRFAHACCIAYIHLPQLILMLALCKTYTKLVSAQKKVVLH